MDTIKINKKNTRMVAHRGLSGIETENTNAAFVAAANRSYFGIETDIYRTADGQFVLHHDKSLARLANVEAMVESMTLSELQALRLHDKGGCEARMDLRLSTPQEYLAICKKYGKHCVPELKSLFTDEEIARLLEIFSEQDYLEHTTFIAFSYENLERVRRIRPAQSVQYLSDNVTDELMEKVVRDRMDVDIKASNLSEENIVRFHEAGILVNCWTVNDAQDAERLIDWGVDFITTNILE